MIRKLYSFLGIGLLAVAFGLSLVSQPVCAATTDHTAKAAELQKVVSDRQKALDNWEKTPGYYKEECGEGYCQNIRTQKYWDAMAEQQIDKNSLKTEQLLSDVQNGKVREKADELRQQIAEKEKQIAAKQKEIDDSPWYSPTMPLKNQKAELENEKKEMEDFLKQYEDAVGKPLSQVENEAAAKEAERTRGYLQGKGQDTSLLNDMNTYDRMETFRSGAMTSFSHPFPKTMWAYMNEYSDACWFCPVFKEMFDAINKLSTTIYSNMAKDFLSLMGVGILFLILFKVAKVLVSLQEVDVMQFLNDLFKPLGRAIIAAALLGVSVAGGKTIFYLLTNPVIDVSMRLGQTMMTTSMGEVKTFTTGTAELDRLAPVKITSVLQEADTAAKAANNTPGNQVLDEHLKTMMEAWMKSVSSSFVVGIAMGGTFVKIGTDDFFGNGFAMALAGAIMWIGFWVIYLMFPFKLIDAFVRLAFVLTLMPLWIILWVFPATSGYTKKAWEMFLGACLTFVVLSVMIALVLQLINHVVPNPLRSAEGTIDRNGFFKLLIDGKNDEAIKYVGFGSGLCMNVIAFCAMSFSLLAAVPAIADGLAGAGASATATQVGNNMTATIAGGSAAAYSIGKNTAKVGAAAVGGLWSGGKSLASKLGTFGGGSGSDSSGGDSSGSGSGGDTGDNSNNAQDQGQFHEGQGDANNQGNTPLDNGGSGDGTGNNHDQGGHSPTPPDNGGNTDSNQGLNNLTGDQQRAVKLMAENKDKDSVGILKDLSEDIAFVEEAKRKHQDPAAYKAAVAHHQWKSGDQPVLDHLANEVGVNNNQDVLSGLYEDAVKGVLKNRGAVKTRSDLDPLANRMRTEIQEGGTVSSFLNQLATNVKKAKSNG